MRMILAMLITLVAGNAMAEDCYTPLTCLYGNDLGRSIEYDRQRRQLQDLQSRQREMELQQEERDRQRELDRLRDGEFDRRWRSSPSR